MKIHVPWLGACLLAIAVALFAFPSKSYADTYQVFGLGSGLDRSLVGITSSGIAVTAIRDCDMEGDGCFETWVDGVRTDLSVTPPNLIYDNGIPCTPDAPPGLNIQVAVCNNGHEVYGTGSSTPIPNRNAIFTGPDLTSDRFGLGPLDGVKLNSSGDFLFFAGLGPLDPDGYIGEALDLTTAATPEPGSIVFLGTGVLAFAGVMRRRLFQ
jgi:hypothetical protein